VASSFLNFSELSKGYSGSQVCFEKPEVKKMSTGEFVKSVAGVL
jgi:hypothetical protein